MLLKLKLLLVWICAISSATLLHEEDINAFLFPKNRNVEFVDLTHKMETSDSYGNSSAGELCVSARRNETWSYRQPQGKLVGNIPLNNLILPLMIVDISGVVNGDSNFVLQKYHLDFILNNYFGRTYQPCLVVFKFGWTERYVENLLKKHSYYEVDEKKEVVKENHPGLSEDLAKWITKSFKNVVGIGVDTPTVDPGLSQEPSAFGTFTDAGVYVMENVKLDQYLPEASCTAVVSPLKSEESCSPYRLMAICPKSQMTPRQYRMHRI
ncbi:putative cyclase domain-containing protein [Phthorimaea operculella]|nr:putative cyclase domain-containing protein [Phthorimaea operculella]